MPERATDLLLGQPVEIGTLQSVSQYILQQAQLRRPAYICFTTAYMLVEALRERSVRTAYAAARMILPDGVPVAWGLHLLGHAGAQCISGPRLMPLLLREAAAQGIAVGFYGGRSDTLERMLAHLRRDLPALQITYVCSPPFRAMTPSEQQPMLDAIVASGTQLLFIGLGSPKQDLWMCDHAASLNAVCLGVGAAFEFLSGEKYLPPAWVQRLGLTWFIRLSQEPRRLLRRNLYSPIFVFFFLRQRLLGKRFEQHASLQGVGETLDD